MATGNLTINIQAKDEVTAFVRRMCVEALKVAILACPDLDTLAVVLQETTERDDSDQVLTNEVMEKLPHWGEKPERYPEALSWDAKRVLVFDEDPMGGWELKERFDTDEAEELMEQAEREVRENAGTHVLVVTPGPLPEETVESIRGHMKKLEGKE